jgi:amino acid transporter
MITVLWAYEGWQFGTYSAGEVIDPQKNFPRAFLAGSLILVGLYLLAVVAYLFALGPAGMAASDTIAATAVGQVLGPWAGKIVALTILISTFSAANSVLLTAPRVFYAMANDIFSSRNSPKFTRAFKPQPPPSSAWAYGRASLSLPVRSARSTSSSAA